MNFPKNKLYKRFFFFNLICITFFTEIFFSSKNNLFSKEKFLDTSFLETSVQTKDYILDTGDRIFINFKSAPELSKDFAIDHEGLIFLPKIKNTYVRGLTVDFLSKLLNEKYKESLLEPDIEIRIIEYKPIKVFVRGEVRKPGIYEGIAKGANYMTSLSLAIKEAGGITPYSDLSKIQVIREVPISDGGGKKKAIIDFTSFNENGDPSNDLILFNRDFILVPKLDKKSQTQVPNSILNGLSPKYMTVSISGTISNPGEIKIPVEGSLSDLMDLTGPRKPLSGKVFLLRYKKDGTLLRNKISYSAKANRGSKKNPYLEPGDYIVVKNSALGKAAGTLKVITEPLRGIYSTKQLIDDI